MALETYALGTGFLSQLRAAAGETNLSAYPTPERSRFGGAEAVGSFRFLAVFLPTNPTMSASVASLRLAGCSRDFGRVAIRTHITRLPFLMSCVATSLLCV